MELADDLYHFVINLEVASIIFGMLLVQSPVRLCYNLLQNSYIVLYHIFNVA